jgi:plastocyanin
MIRHLRPDLVRRVHNDRVRRTVTVVGLLAVTACGGSAPSSPSTGTTGTTVTITTTGVNPTQLTVSQGSRVLFVNNDTRPHNMASDPHPEHTDCPEINEVGLLQPGQRRETGNLNTIRTCGFHDHDDPPPGGNKWTGKITIH